MVTSVTETPDWIQSASQRCVLGARFTKMEVAIPPIALLHSSANARSSYLLGAEHEKHAENARLVNGYAVTRDGESHTTIVDERLAGAAGDGGRTLENSPAWARVLATGGAGFIGSHTVVELLGAGMEVVCV